MTPYDKLLVRQSWALAVPHAEVLVTSFYARVFELDPQCRSLFRAVDMKAQGSKLAAMLTVVVNMLEEPENLVPLAASLGKRHAGYQVKDHHYTTVGEALIWAFKRTIGPAFNEEVEYAWVQAYALLASLMQRGATVNGALAGA